MSIDGIAAIIFILALAIFLWRKRHRVEFQKALFPILYVVLYRSKFGIKTMDKWAKRHPRLIRFFGDFAILIGFLGMVLICAQLVYSTVQLFTAPGGIPGIQPVLPFRAKGVFFVPFIYWIVSIFLLALVHEFAHGVLARAHKMPVKSSGFAFLCLVLPIIPAAFVEPDEKVVEKRPNRQQLSVFAAGPVSNMVFALICLGIVTLMTPVLSSSFDTNGIELVSSTKDGPAYDAGLRDEDVMLKMNGVVLESVKNVTMVLSASSPGDRLLVETTDSSMFVTLEANPKNESQAFMGIHARPNLIPNQGFVAKYGKYTPHTLQWIGGLIFWLFLLNIGIGLFNLLPIGPLDGGRMFQLVCFKYFKKRATALKVWTWVSMFFVVLILGNLLIGFLR